MSQVHSVSWRKSIIRIELRSNNQALTIWINVYQNCNSKICQEFVLVILQYKEMKGIKILKISIEKYK